MRFEKLALLTALISSGFTSLASADYWTPWVSEEGGSPPSICTSWSEGAVGADCRGSRCDDVRLRCQTLPPGVILDGATDYWSEWFSEEDSGLAERFSIGWYRTRGDNYHVCNGVQYSAGILNGIRCRGSRCDDLSLECDVPIKLVNNKKMLVAPTNCSWTGWSSEEQGAQYFGFNRFITGVMCSGGNCDNHAYYVCTIDGTQLVDPASTPKF